MKKISTVVLVSFVAAVGAGCALNPFAEDNIYKRKNTENAATDTQQRTAGDMDASFKKADSDNNGLISKQEADRISGLPAVFDKYNPDRDGTLDWNEFTAAMQSVNMSKN